MEMNEDFPSVRSEPVPSSLEDHPTNNDQHTNPTLKLGKKTRYRKKEETCGHLPFKIILLILCSIPALASMSPNQLRLESSKHRTNSSWLSPDDFLRQGIAGLNSSWPEALLKRSARQTHLPRTDLENGSVIPADRKSKLIHHSSSGSEEDQPKQRFGEHCECWNFSDGHIREVECSCSQLSANMSLPQEIHRITVEESHTFTTLANEYIRPFSSSLLEINLVELPEFVHIQDGAFIGMRNLHTIYLLGAPALTNISQNVFKGFFPKLKNIKIVHTGLEVTPMLNQLMTNTHLESVDLENNKISRIEPRWVEKLKVEHLTLSYNNLRSIGPAAFEGATIARLTLKGNHQLTGLHPNAFAGIESLRQLDLSETAITILPTHGLKHLEILRVQRTPSLTVIPSIYHFESLKEAAMTYPYHCCAFANPETHDPVEYKKFQEFVEKIKENKCEGTTTMSSPTDGQFSTSVEFSDVMRRRRRQIFNTLDSSSKGLLNDGQKEYESSWTSPGVSSELDSSANTESFTEGRADDGGFHDPYYVFDPDKSFTPLDNHQEQERISSWETDHSERNQPNDFGTFHPVSVTLAPQVIQLCGNVAVKKIPIVKCTPEPDAFSPCEDIMGNMWLRTAVWIVVTLALVGNMAVLIVLILTPGRMSVQRFLMANLSFADLCMGIYLLMVAVEDLVSLGVYFNFAIDWQLGWGCQLAGFLTVFASELSVFTLAVITGERWYALTRAIHLTKRLTIKGAAKLMVFGWVLAINLALLPLVGVSSYSKTSICLPMEASSTLAQVYLAFMLLFNGIAFTMVAYAYFQMYRTVAGHSTTGAPATQSADLAIAKKMGLLVFTDFVCWAPVAFFGLTAVAGHPLIDVTDAKILLVFFYPLNSFCNPYLYAILTKQYRRDLFLLLHRHGMCTNTMARFRSAAASTNNTVPTMQTMMRIGSVSVTDTARHNSGRISVSSVSADHVHPTGNSVGVTRITDGSDLQSSLASAPVKKQRSKLSKDHHHSIHFDVADGDCENSIDERTQAETSFISIPLSEHQDNSNRGKISKPSGRHRIDSRVAVLPPIKDSTDDHEISEITPFCTTTES